MHAEYRQRLADYVSEFHLPRYAELPDIGLHLEQVLRYVDRYLPGVVTGSMVSNYVKQKLIPGPVKKSYYPASIGYLIFVAFIKNVMSLEDIRLLIDVQKKSYSLSVAYDYFCDEFENLLQYVSGLKAVPDQMGVTQSEEKELLRTALFSITYKIYMNQYMDLIRAGGEFSETNEP